MSETYEKASSRLTKSKYLLGLFVIYATAYSQYLLPSESLVFSLLFVYGIPIVIISSYWGRYTLHRFFNRMSAAVKYGFASYGGFTGLSYIITFVIILLIIIFDPTALSILNNPNPILNTTPENAWVMVWVSVRRDKPARCSE